MSMTAELDVSVLCEHLQLILRTPSSATKLYQAIVNAPFGFTVETALLFLGFICFYLIDEAKQVIYLVGASDNEYYKHSIEGYNFNPEEYKIRLDDEENSIAQAVTSSKSVGTRNWDTLRRPRVGDGIARLNQASSGIGYSVVVPLVGRVKGALMYNYFQDYDALGDEQEAFMRQYTKLVSDALAA